MNISTVETDNRDESTAWLSSRGRYIVFSYGDRTLRFIASDKLERILSVKEWDDGYIVVMMKYSVSEEPVEDYIDLRPILENLYIDPDSFLKPIKKVVVRYPKTATEKTTPALQVPCLRVPILSEDRSGV